eukprot:SAG25_NODE_296_length_10244_cov_67.215081_1_plen_136_part_00
MAGLASQLVVDNGFAGSITVVHSALEDIQELPGGTSSQYICGARHINAPFSCPAHALYGLRTGPVDILVSEWMGFCAYPPCAHCSARVDGSSPSFPCRACVFLMLTIWRCGQTCCMSPCCSRCCVLATGGSSQEG